MAYTGNQTFAGLDARRAAPDGAIRDMENMSRRFYPAMASRTLRRKLDKKWADFGGAYYGERDFVVYGGKLYDNGTAVCSVTAGEKQMAVLENKLYIFPDKIEYDIEKRTYRDLGKLITNFHNGNLHAEISYTEEPHEGDVWTPVYVDDLIFLRRSDFPVMPFVTGTLLKVSLQGLYNGKKSTEYLVLGTVTIHNIYISNEAQECWVLYFPLGSFDSVSDGRGKRTRIKVSISRGVPNLDFVFSSNNRLWGADGRNIYASALGDGSAWIDYDTLATSSWAATTQIGDEITAALDFGGMPVFFAENAAYKIYGENPKEFQYVRQSMIGVTEGEHKSVAAGAGYIFYLTRRGVYAWTGGVPWLISDPLGDERIKDAVGGSDGVVYYLSCEQGGRHNLYMFEPMENAWIREDDSDAVDIRLRGRDLCMVKTDGTVHLIGDVFGDEGTEEESIFYAAETADYNDGAVVNKSAKNILIQHELTGGEADVMVSYDGEPWNHVYTLHDTDGKKLTSVIPLQEKRYRTMRIRIEGDGEIVIYYMVRDVNVHTERPGGEKNVYV